MGFEVKNIEDVSNKLVVALSNLNEDEFVQMVLPMVHLLNVEQLEFLSVNITSEEIVELIGKIRDTTILNKIALETCDGVVAAECGKHSLLELESLNSLLDRFFSVYHLITYTKHPVADNDFFFRVVKILEDCREKNQGSLQGEVVILKQIAKHTKADASVLKIIANYVEGYLVEMVSLREVIKAMPRFKNCRWGTTSLDYRVRSGFEEGKKYNDVYRQVKDYFPALLEVMSNENFPPEDQLYFVERYGDYSLVELESDLSDYGMMVVSRYFGVNIHNADTIKYRASINKNCPIELKVKGPCDIAGDETIWTQGQKFITRWALLYDLDQIRSAWGAWKEKQGEARGFSSDTLENLILAFKKNPRIPSDVLTDMVKYIIQKGRFYKEIIEHLVNHPNLDGEGVELIVDQIVNLSENYINFMCTSVIVPICKSKNISKKAASSLFKVLKPAEVLIALAGNDKVEGLDEEFSKHFLRGVRRAYAGRSVSLEWLEYLLGDSERDVVVAARRQYRKLTGKQLLSLVKENFIEVK